MPQLSFDSSRADVSTNGEEVSSLDNVGLDVDLGDMGLRHRSADGMGEKKSSRHESSKDEA